MLLKTEALIIGCVALVSLSGCAGKYPITFDSKPVSGKLICENEFMGYTPKTLYYELTNDNKKSGDLYISKCMVKWSENQTQAYSQHFDLSKFPNGVITTANSPYRYSITFDTHPQGATLICNNKNLGYTPRTVSYLLYKSNYAEIEQCKAVWASGYSASYSNYINSNTSNTNINLMLNRPTTDGYTNDVEAEIKVKEMLYRKQQAEAAERSARAQRDAADAAVVNAIANKKAARDAYYQNLERNRQLRKTNDYLRYGF